MPKRSAQEKLRGEIGALHPNRPHGTLSLKNLNNFLSSSFFLSFFLSFLFVPIGQISVTIYFSRGKA